MDRKSKTCACVYCNEACRMEKTCVGCGTCVCHPIPCAFEISTERGRGSQPNKRREVLCAECHNRRHGTCFHCKKNQRDAKETHLCCGECPVCLKLTCGSCSLRGSIHSDMTCKNCAAWQSRSFHCPHCNVLTDRKNPGYLCTLCNRPVCVNDPENWRHLQCPVEDCSGESPVDLCCQHLIFTQQCQKCGSLGYCAEHRIPCDTCGRPAICAECSPDLRALWDSHDVRKDAATGMYAPMLLTQCKSCQHATRDVLQASGMAMDLQRLLYKTLFAEGK